MTALRKDLITMVSNIPEEHIPVVIDFIRSNHILKSGLSPKRQAFLDLDKMIDKTPVEIDYEKELSQIREERFGNAGAD